MEKENVKLLIQINCFNEAEDLHIVFNKLPKQLDGVGEIETLVIDDGSDDDTYEIAQKLGATYTYRNFGNKGIPRSLNHGMLVANSIGANILINMDADNQHDPKDIPKLIKPILEKNADLVHGERKVNNVNHTSFVKKILQNIGARMVSWIAGFKIKDASSGYRALNRTAFSKINLLYDYASPLEYLIQAKNKNLTVETVDITANEAVRPSKLIKSIFKYVTRSGAVILDNLLVYRSLGCFLTLGFSFSFAGIALSILRFNYVQETEGAHLTLLISSIVLIVAGVQFIFFAFLARLVRANRRTGEEVAYRDNMNSWGNGKITI